MRRFLLILALLAIGCGSTGSRAVREVPEGMEMLSRAEDRASSHTDRTLGHLSDLWSDHLKDSTTGLDFTIRSIQRTVRQDWGRVVGFFD